ncbi:MAG: hypothetical protein K2I10_14365, partial [Lachnospiraceae bacterium]|nr:hypothetical protein [Lachnospiraceae bacterium]
MATIAEKSRTKEIIERLQGLIETASPVPFAAGKVSIYKDEIQTLLTELASQMDIELKTYHEVNDRRGKIINEAKKEAEKIIFQAEHSASRMRVSKRATNVAPLNYDLLDEEEVKSLGNANEIYAASLIYTDEMLSEVTDVISDAYKNICSDYEIMLQVLEEKLQMINSNKEELMNGLQEMEKEDRSQQILEIGQLLSNELYNERMKHKVSTEEYDDGSIQLALDFQKKQEELTKQAEEKAAWAEQELIAMQAERDNLLAVIEQMKEREEAAAALAYAVSAEDENAKYEIEYVTEEELAEGEEYEIEYITEEELAEGEEYEIEYVTEEELAEGEEYEIEYVTEEESAEDEKYEDLHVEESDKEYEIGYAAEEETDEGEEYKIEYAAEEEKSEDEEYKIGYSAEEESEEDEEYEVKYLDDDEKELEEGVKNDTGSGSLPVVPRFKKAEKVASAPSGQIAKMAKAVTTDERYSGLIEGAATNKEKADAPAFVREGKENKTSNKETKA